MNQLPHRQKRFAGRRCDRDRVIVWSISTRTAAEIVLSQRLIQRVERHSVRCRQVLWSNTDDHSPRTNDLVSVWNPARGPSRLSTACLRIHTQRPQSLESFSELKVIRMILGAYGSSTTTLPWRDNTICVSAPQSARQPGRRNPSPTTTTPLRTNAFTTRLPYMITKALSRLPSTAIFRSSPIRPAGHETGLQAPKSNL